MASTNKALLSGQFFRLVKEGFWIGLGSALVILGALVGVRLLTEVLSPTAYGELALGMTITTLVNQISMGPLSSGAMRFYAPAVEKNEFSSYLAGVRKLVLSATGFIIILMIALVIGLQIAGQTNWILLTLAATLFAVLSGYDSILSSVQNAARQRVIVALHRAMGAWGRYLIAVLLVLWLGPTSSVAMLGYSLALFPVLGSQWFFFQRTLRCQGSIMHQQGWQKQIWQYSWPFASWGVFYWAQVASDRWALELFTSTQEVGFYAVLFQLGYYPMSMVSNIAMQLLGPIFYQRAGDGKDHQRNSDVNKLSWRLTLISLCLTISVTLISFLFHKQIFSIFVAQKYISASYYLPWIMLSGGVFAAGQTIALNLTSQMKTQSMIVAKIVTAMLGIALNFLGAYWYGLRGVVIASILFSIIYFLWISVLSYQQQTKSLSV
ncbi:MAG: oligosaccharide flippase family protein [Cyanobacteria bacterium P01_B01_bin.77]